MAAHEQLLMRVWGQDNSGGSSPVRTYVKRLRRKPGDDAGSPKYILAEPRVGYRMPKEKNRSPIIDRRFVFGWSVRRCGWSHLGPGVMEGRQSVSAG